MGAQGSLVLSLTYFLGEGSDFGLGEGFAREERLDLLVDAGDVCHVELLSHFMI